MSLSTNIQWTDATWNIAVGCSKVDADCKNCYMFRDSLKATRYEPGIVRQTKNVFNTPLKLKTPSKIFTCSLSDFFHPDVDAFRDQAWEIIRKCPQHTFQILTKRPERIVLPEFWAEISSRVWFGTSCGSTMGLDRINVLKSIFESNEHKPILFVSFEPLYERLTEAITNHLDGIDWVIIGGESGNNTGAYKYRECSEQWIAEICGLAKFKNISVFVKQMGTFIAQKRKMSDRHGTKIEEFPSELQIREFPTRKSKPSQ